MVNVPLFPLNVGNKFLHLLESFVMVRAILAHFAEVPLEGLAFDLERLDALAQPIARGILDLGDFEVQLRQLEVGFRDPASQFRMRSHPGSNRFHSRRFGFLTYRQPYHLPALIPMIFWASKEITGLQRSLVHT